MVIFLYLKCTSLRRFNLCFRNCWHLINFWFSNFGLNNKKRRIVIIHLKKIHKKTPYTKMNFIFVFFFEKIIYLITVLLKFTLFTSMLVNIYLTKFNELESKQHSHSGLSTSSWFHIIILIFYACIWPVKYCQWNLWSIFLCQIPHKNQKVQFRW